MDFIYTIISSIITALIFLLGWSVTIGRKLQVLDDLKEGLQEVRDDIKKLIDRVANLEGRVEQIADRHSPLAPTIKGVSFIKESGLAAILDDPEKHAFLIEKLKAELPEDYLDYDVEVNSVYILNRLENDRMMRPIKIFAYEHGVSAGSILGIGALWLRDDFLGIPRRSYAER